MDITYRSDYGFIEVTPTGKLEEENFQDLAREIESLRDSGRELKGVLVCTKDFPGWERFSDLLAHGDFVRDHHDKIRKIAFCTDSNIGEVFKTVGKNFAEAEVERFEYDEKDEAEKWLLA